MTISPPRQPIDHPDRAVDCAFALESAFQGIEKAALAAGWTPAEVAVALMDLTKNSLLSLAENRRTQASIDVSRMLDELPKRGS